MSKWISVKDRLPVDTQLVLTDDGVLVWCSIYNTENEKFESLERDRHGDFWEVENITHWQPLPGPHSDG